jgi:hypothetical protein
MWRLVVCYEEPAASIFKASSIVKIGQQIKHRTDRHTHDTHFVHSVVNSEFC